MRRAAVLLSLSALCLALLPLGPGNAAPVSSDPDAIPGSYIVVLKAGEPGSVAGEHSRRHGAAVRHVYRHALRGYSARMSERAAGRIARDPRVAYVEQDRVVSITHHLCGHNKPSPGSCDQPPPPPPQAGTLSGTVTGDGSGLGSATVAVGGTGLSTMTDSSGAYSIADVPAGTYQVMASKSGFVSQTKSVTIDGNRTVDFALVSESSGTSTQMVPWGISRIGAPLANTGAGIHVYVIDTGIDPSHADLNVSSEGYAAESCRGGACSQAWADDHGHGTHVAGTIGARDNDLDVVGVAPGVTLHAVKVLSKNGSGPRSSVIAGINWVAGHNAGMARVVNMSLGGSGSKASTSSCTGSGYSGTDSYHEAICQAARTGAVFAVSAGNSGANAANSVPAAYDDAVITVSATTSSSNWPSWSNWGNRDATGIPSKSAPVGIAAPGVNVLSTRLGGGTATMSGTSMAAPHATGAAALFLSKNPQTATYSAFSNTRADLLGSRAQPTRSGSSYVNGWSNTSGNTHVERFLQVTGL